MLTTKYVRDHLEEIRESLNRRKSDYPIGKLLDLDREWRECKTQLQELQSKRNRASIEVSELKKKGMEIKEKVESLSYLKEQIEEMEMSLDKDSAEMEKLLWNMPNVLDRAVPYGEGEDQNVEIRKWGEVDNSRKGANHQEALERLGLLEIEQASVVSGARFYYLKGDLALLEQALIRFGIDEMTKKGYTLIAPPLMLRKEFYKGVAALGDFEELLYRVSDPNEASGKTDYEKTGDDLFLIATSEHPMAALHANQVLDAGDLPKKYLGISPCFRREAGSRSKDTKGIFRVHNFYKIEQFIFSKPEDSGRYFDELLANAEGISQKLKLPYRVLEFCTGGIGAVAARKNDIEAYMYGQKAYREVASCSNCTDWQSVRLNIRYDERGERRYVHTLNSTLIPTTRMIVAITENYLNGDGTITVPDALVPYMGKSRIG
ncbi:MAG: serine--tRNA ligase [Candidatus Micrarchaeota archaeon]|nr:serine--tRNA ligase [Candidatus Micrarchaeota archaeon]